MNRTVYVIGHRNPDTDSIASAISYADFKRQTGFRNVHAAMAGMPNPQTKYILERLGVPQPIYLADVHPRVSDLVRRSPIVASASLPIREALQLFHANNIRVVPVVDGDNRPVGLVSLLKLSERYLVAGSDRRRGVDASFNSIARSLEGRFVAGEGSGRVEHLHLFIGAMGRESFRQRISTHDPRSIIVMTGDRPTIQKEAVDAGVRLLVVTGGFGVDTSLRERAIQAGVSIVTTPFDTSTAAFLIRLSTPLSCYVDGSFPTIRVGEPLEKLRFMLIHGGESAVVVVGDDGRVSGVATRSTLLAPIPFSLILVDHNELSQAVPGAESVEILEVIDHHRLGNPPTSAPITFMAAPVGSTCTIVASLYRERGIVPTRQIASLLLAGIMSDTVILKSPTTTLRDREIVQWLEPISGLSHQEFGREIFASCSGFSPHGTPENALMSDFKTFPVGSGSIGIGQVEVVGFDEFTDLTEKLRQALEVVMAQEALVLAGLMVTDITTETTLFQAVSRFDLPSIMGYPELYPGVFEMRGVMSRKKQVVPHLQKILAGIV
ncbi:MAG: putative manganese-dependent inorganic diphosphatase [Desulfuromonadia bacterium]